jgi:putative effector of murein hydrolase
MNLDWQGTFAVMVHHPLFGIGVTLGVYQLALAAYERTRWLFLQPVLLSMMVLIAVLVACGLSYVEYRKSTEIMGVLLGPATVALAVPLYQNLRRIRQLFAPTLTTLVVGGVFATGLCLLLGWLFGATHMVLMTLAPKSVTSPIAMLVAEQSGGVGSGVRVDHRRDWCDFRADPAAAAGRGRSRGAGHGAGLDCPRGGHLGGVAGK